MANSVVNSLMVIGFVFIISIENADGQLRRCSPGWFGWPRSASIRNSCYFFSRNWYTWNEARSICQAAQGDLVTIRTRQEQNRIRMTVRRRRTSFSIGFNNVVHKAKTATWVDGTRWQPWHTRWWAPKEPNNRGGKEFCGEMMSTGQYNDVQCTGRRRRFICRRHRDIVDPCDTARGWGAYGTQCIRLFGEPLDWKSARRSCQQNGANLLVVDTEAKLGAIKESIACRQPSEIAWLGLSDTETPGKLTWVDGSNVGIANWNRRQPRQLVDGDTCVETMASIGWRWRTSSCLNERKYLCEKPQGKCAEGWKEWSGHCYQVNADKSIWKTWIDAKNYCDAQGARLIDIKSAREHNLFVRPLARQLKAGGIRFFYSGLSDGEVQGKFKWTDGSEPQFKRWRNRNQPRWYPGRWSCGVVITRDRFARWGTRYCFVKRAFVCEMGIGETHTPYTPPPTKACYDNDWFNLNDKCYLFSSGATLTWMQAQQECSAKYGANLATINTPEVQSFISINIVDNSHVGLTNRGRSPKDLRWLETGEALGNFTNWQQFHPILGVPDINCVNLKRSGGRRGVWSMLNCTWARGYVCQKVSTNQIIAASTTPTMPWSDLCGPDWTYDVDTDFCYKINLDDNNFFEAEEICKKSSGGELLSIGSKHEQMFVQKLLKSSEAGGGIQFWMGGNNLVPDAGWRWTDNSAFRFFNWNPGMPDTREGANCMKIENTKEGHWVTDLCEGRYKSVCKKATFNDSAVTAPMVTTASPRDCVGERMVSGLHYVQDAGLKASSQRSDETKPANSRIIPADTSTKGWQPQYSSANQWIEADFTIPIVIKGIVTKGMSNPSSAWVTKYKILHLLDAQSNWIWYSETGDGVATEIQGNSDVDTEVKFTFTAPFQARYVRLMPTEWSSDIGLRWDVIGCIRRHCKSEDVITGDIRATNDRLTASSTAGTKNGPASSRINSVSSTGSGGAWTASPGEDRPWIQADLSAMMRIKRVTTKGRDGSPEWVSHYKLSYSLDGTNFKIYEEPFGQEKLFEGNTDPGTPVTNELKSPIAAQYIRLHPLRWVGHASVRWEVNACILGCEPIGLLSADHSVKDAALEAASSLTSFSGPSRSRIDTVVDGNFKGAWTAAFNGTDQYIQADLGANIYIRAISTRGRYDRDEWVTQYIVGYSSDGQTWYAYFEDGVRKIFSANFDRNTAIKNVMKTPFSARYVRLYPQASVGKSSLRWELHGCPGPLSGYHLGCYADTRSDPDLSRSPILKPIGGMTSRICINHCYHQGYLFAGIRTGDTCMCENTYGRHGSSSGCDIKCAGRPEDTCGGSSAVSVYNTGLGPSDTMCPTNWLSYKDSCYLVSASRQTYDDAVSICRDEKAHLVSVHLQDEMDYITSVVEDTEGLWIGLNDRAASRTYEWEDGSPVDYTNWDIGQPSNWATRAMNCVFSNLVNGRWTSRKCDYTKKFMCKKMKSPTTDILTTSPPAGCPRDWTLWDGNCYLIVYKKNIWAQAVTNCRTMDAELVRIKSRQEQLYIRSQISGITESVWTDLSDTANPGTYIWSDGSTDVGYTNWARGQPDDSKGSCVSMGSMDNLGRWFDQDCTMFQMSMCKRPQDGVTTTPSNPFSPSLQACPGGWIEYKQNCFLINMKKTDDERKSWPAARADCVARGGELASFHSKEELDTVWLEHIAGSLSHFWIGLNTRDPNRGHMWSDLMPVTYTYWAPGEPNNVGNVEDCVEMYRNDGKWNDIRCDVMRNWICKVRKGNPVSDLSTTPPPIPQPRGSCKPDDFNWWMYNGRCYFFNDGNVYNTGMRSWRYSQRWCFGKDGDLVSIHSQDELNFVIGMIGRLNLTTDNFWIGLSELDLRQGYRWADSSPLDFTNWGTNEPNDDYGNEPCISLSTSGRKSGEWYNHHCDVRKGFVCTKYVGGKAPPTPAPPSPINGNCPAGFVKFANKCFKFVSPNSPSELMTYDQAREACVGIGRTNGYQTDLASISNNKEQAFITAHLVDMKSNMWIGLRQPPVGDTNKFSWEDKSPVTYTNWRSGQPDQGLTKDGNCVSMDVASAYKCSGKWFDAFCWTKNGYVCQTAPQSSLMTPAPTENPCPRDYTPWRNGCYLIVRSSKTWQDSRSYCARTASGAHLATITDHIEQSYVYSLMNLDEVGSDIWNGLSDYFTPGTFVWANQWPITYTAWGHFEPGRSSGGCVAMRSTDGRWKDIPCTNKLPAICKVTQAPPPTTASPVVEGTCPPSDGEEEKWIRFGSYCYMIKTFYKHRCTQKEADYHCIERDAQLYSVHSQEEHEFIFAELNKTRRPLWVGLSRTNTQGWVWRDNTPVNYVRWAPGYPSNRVGRTDRYCVDQKKDGLWRDTNCEYTRTYVCKRPVRPQRVTGTVPFNTDPNMGGQPTSMKTPPVAPETTLPTLAPRTTTQSFTRWRPPTWNPPTFKPITRRPFTDRPGYSTSPPMSTRKNSGPNDIKEVGKQTSGGEIAAIVILSLILIAFIVFVVFLFMRTKTKVGKPSDSSTGFDNAMYSANDDTLEVGSTKTPQTVGP